MVVKASEDTPDEHGATWGDPSQDGGTARQTVLRLVVTVRPDRDDPWGTGKLTLSDGLRRLDLRTRVGTGTSAGDGRRTGRRKRPVPTVRPLVSFLVVVPEMGRKRPRGSLPLLFRSRPRVPWDGGRDEEGQGNGQGPTTDRGVTRWPVSSGEG